MHSLLKNHFEVQTGMYFDYFTTYGNWMISMSNIIEDSFWNYAVIPENCNLEKELPIVEEMLRRASRPLSVYVINEKEHSDYISCLLKHGYNKVCAYVNKICASVNVLAHDDMLLLHFKIPLAHL